MYFSNGFKADLSVIYKGHFIHHKDLNPSNKVADLKADQGTHITTTITVA